MRSPHWYENLFAWAKSVPYKLAPRWIKLSILSGIHNSVFYRQIGEGKNPGFMTIDDLYMEVSK